MKQFYKYILLLLLMNILLDVAGYFLVSTKKYDIIFSDIAILTSLFSIIAVITLLIFLRGQDKDPESQTIHTLFAVGLKLLLEMGLALLWFVVIKKTSLESVFIFFVIYLTLTIYSVWIILKTLKYKSLQNNY